MKSKVEASVLNKTEYPEWDSFVSTSTSGSIYSTAAYLEILSEVTGCSFKILAAKQGNEFTGGIGLFEQPIQNHVIVAPRLLLYYNGIVLRDYQTKYPSQAVSRQLKTLAVLEKTLAAYGYHSIKLRNRRSIADVRTFQVQNWRTRIDYTYTVYLSNLENLWEQIDPNLQRLIKRCQTDQYMIKINEDFDTFYSLHSSTHERKGSPIYLSYRDYKRYYEMLRRQNLCNLYHACESNGTPVSSQLVLLGDHPVTHTVCAATDKNYLNPGVSAFLRWKVFEDLSHEGYLANDLTDASLNPVTKFKSQLGGNLELCIELFKPPEVKNRFIHYLKRKIKNVLKRF